MCINMAKTINNYNNKIRLYNLQYVKMYKLGRFHVKP